MKIQNTCLHDPPRYRPFPREQHERPRELLGLVGEGQGLVGRGDAGAHALTRDGADTGVQQS